MPKKKGVGGIQALRKNVAKRKPRPRRSNPDTPAPALRSNRRSSNPPFMQDLGVQVLPGIGSYAATRFSGKLLRAALGKKFPTLEQHLGPAGNILAAVILWFAVHKSRKLARYHTPIIVGSAVAVLESIIQCYLPRLAVLIDAAPAQPQLAKAAPQATGHANGHQRRAVRYVSPGELEIERGPASSVPPPQTATSNDEDDDGLGNDAVDDALADVEDDNFNSGIFAGGL